MAKAKRKFETSSNIRSMDEARQANKKRFHPSDMISLSGFTLTPPQEQFLESFFNQTEIIAQVGAAGTGKTMLAMYAAFSEVFSEGTPYDHVKIIRSSAQAREMGFMPGSAEEKLQPFTAPYVKLCDELLKYKNNNFNNLMALGYISFESTAFLRGQTWDNTIVIFDEFQSATIHEIMTVITRLGVNSKIVLCGDHRQNDLVKRNDKSGFHDLMDILGKMDRRDYDVAYYGVEHIVRSGIVKKVLTAAYQ